MEKVMKIFLACALGAFIGTMTTLQLNHYFWWLGLLVGGFVGYISYEFKKVLAAVPQAYRVVSGWRPDKEYWKKYFYIEGIFFSFILTLTLPLIVITARIEIALLICVFVFILVGFMAARDDNLDFVYDKGKVLSQNEIIFYLHPLPFYFYHLPSIIWWCVTKGIPRVITTTAKKVVVVSRFTGRFIKHLFILIHSDIRLLCATDAAIGTAIGYFSGSALIGAMAGGAFGVVNYLVVSVKLLKLNRA